MYSGNSDEEEEWWNAERKKKVQVSFKDSFKDGVLE